MIVEIVGLVLLGLFAGFLAATLGIGMVALWLLDAL